MDSLDIEYSITAESSRTAHTGALTEAAFWRVAFLLACFHTAVTLGGIVYLMIPSPFWIHILLETKFLMSGNKIMLYYVV